MWTKTFLLNLAENVLQTGASAFGASLVVTTTPTLKDFEAALVAGGMAALYTFVKGVGGSQALKAVAPIPPALPVQPGAVAN